jgi:hypothetical protein
LPFAGRFGKVLSERKYCSLYFVCDSDKYKAYFGTAGCRDNAVFRRFAFLGRSGALKDDI